MSHTVLRSFRNLPDAQHAARHLMQAGIPSSKVHIDSLEDEAGGTGGNFAIGNPETKRGPLHGSSISIDDREYNKDFNPVQRCGSILLTVDLDDAEQEIKVAALLKDYGVDPNNPVSH